jgi:hypothetical protein
MVFSYMRRIFLMGNRLFGADKKKSEEPPNRQISASKRLEKTSGCA